MLFTASLFSDAESDTDGSLGEVLANFVLCLALPSVSDYPVCWLNLLMMPDASSDGPLVG